MREMFEEFGGVVTATSAGIVLIGIIVSIMSPDNPIGDGIRTIIKAGLAL